MANKEKQAENKEKIGIGAWLALIVLILVLSGAFQIGRASCRERVCVPV